MPTIVLAALFAAQAGPTADTTQSSRPARVLIVTGMDHPAHNWKATAPALRDVLEAGKQCAARIVEDPEMLASDIIFDYDVLVLQFRNEHPLAREAQARANLTRFVNQGGGLVLIHFACGAFGDWPEFGELAGRIWDGQHTHDPRGRFTVRITPTPHPITEGLRDFETDDELYIGLEGRWPITVLGVARSRTTGQDHPMAFTRTYGRGRVFHTALGHDAKAIQIPAVATLIRRGVRWTASRTP